MPIFTKSVWECLGNGRELFPEFPGKCPGQIRDMSGQILEHVREISRKCPETVLDISWKIPEPWEPRRPGAWEPRSLGA